MTNLFAIGRQPEVSELLSTLNSNLRRARIVVFGTFGAGNLGNECTVQAMLCNIRRHLPGAEISCVCSGPEETSANYRIPAFPIRYAVSVERLFGVHARSDNTLVRCLRKVVRLSTGPYRWYKAFKILKGKDMLLITGLGMLGDFGISPFGLHYDILGWSIVAKLCHCKLEFISVGVGPIRDRVSRCFVRTALSLADYRSYRDRFSREYLERIGFSTMGDRVCPDLAFSLPETMLPDSRKCGHHKAVIGVGLLPYYNRRGRSEGGDGTYRKYMASVAGLTCTLMERGYTVRLLIGDTMYDQRVRRDLRMLLEARGQEYGDARLVDEPASSVAELWSQLAATDLVVASRFHNLLLSIMLGKPVVAVSYHEKIVSLMDEFGLSKFCHDIEDFDADKLISQITALERNTGTLKCRALIGQRIEGYRKVLDEQYELIFRQLPAYIPQ
jgi:polysaccharide pyruvyl transferase WcaK-like protein